MIAVSITKSKGANNNIVATINNNENKDVSLNNKCVIKSINIIQSKNYRIGTYKTNKIY